MKRAPMALGTAQTVTPLPGHRKTENSQPVPRQSGRRAVADPKVSGSPWHPEDEEAFGHPDHPHPRWQDYVEVQMAKRVPPPWPRFWDWLDQDSKRRGSAPPVKIFQRVTNPVHDGEPQETPGGAHAKAG